MATYLVPQQQEVAHLEKKGDRYYCTMADHTVLIFQSEEEFASYLNRSEVEDDRVVQMIDNLNKSGSHLLNEPLVITIYHVKRDVVSSVEAKTPKPPEEYDPYGE